MTYRISKSAQHDLEEIWLYTLENWSIKQADHYLDLIIDEVEFLAKNPLSGKDYNQVREDYYRSKVKSHFIFYRINHDEKLIEVIRILHQEMDIDNRLQD